MLPTEIAGVEIHHEHRVLYKSLPKHHDHLYKFIFSDGKLNRIARTEFFRRQSVMSFADRQEQLLAERLVGGLRAARAIQKNRSYVEKPAINRTNSLESLLRYAPFIVVLFHRP
jgi:hypothetical protein